LASVVPVLRSVPILPIIEEPHREYGMFGDFFIYPWVLRPYHYRDLEALIAVLDEHVIAPAEAKVVELARLRAAQYAP